MIKKFSKILVVIACVFCSAFAFAGCNNGLKGGPESSSVVYGNGGLAVVKGDYVYYVNGYTNYADVTSKSKNSNVKKSALYRTKLVNGKLDYTYNEKDTEQKYSNTLTSTEVVVSKVVGHENTALYIYDNNIYYSTPNTDKDREGNVKNEYLDFYATNLNGTGTKHIYKTQSSSSNQKYAFTKIGKTVYLLCYDGTNLVVVNTSNKSVKTISNAVTSVEFSVSSTYASANYVTTDFDSYVYYTRANADENASGNVFAKAKITTGEETVLNQDTAKTTTLIGAVSGDLYYSVVNSAINSNVTTIYRNNTELITNNFTNTYAFTYSDGVTTGLIGTTDSGITLVRNNGTVENLYSNKATVSEINNGYVYFLEESALYKIEILNKENKVKVSGDFTVNSSIENNYMSVSGIYAFFYADYEGESGTNAYLTMADTTVCEDGVCSPSFIGLFIGKDKPTEEYDK